MALELRTEYPLYHKAATGAPVIAQESFGLHEVFSVRKKRSKVVTRQNARPFYTEGWVFYWQKALRTVWFLLIIMKTIKRRDTCG